MGQDRNKLPLAGWIDLLAVWVGPPLLLFLLLPLTVYWLNPGEVAVSKWRVAGFGALALPAATLPLFILAACRPVLRRGLTRAGEVAFPVLLALIALPNRAGELTGFQTPASFSANFFPALKIVLLTALFLMAQRRWPKHLAWLNRSLLIGAALLCVIFLAGIEPADATARPESAPGPEYVTRLGRRRNVVVVVFDGFTGYRMAELLREHPEFGNDFSGFTLYPRAIAPALNTSVGVGAILSGELKWSDSRESETLRNSLNVNRSFLPQAQELGFRVSFLSPLKTPLGGVPAAGESILYPAETRLEGLLKYLDFWSDSLPRVLPPIVCGGGRAASGPNDSTVSFGAKEMRRARLRQAAFSRFVDGLHLGVDSDRILFYHTWLTHPPYLLSDSGTVSSQEDGFETSFYALKEIRRLLRRLRELGRYDASLIVFAADHGIVPIRDATMGGLFPPGRALHRIHNPLIMVKPPAARSRLRISSMSVWLGDVNATVCDYLGVRGPGTRRWGNRSLLQAEDVDRRLKVPLYMRPEGISFHSGLAQWWRFRYRGTFAEYGRKPR